MNNRVLIICNCSSGLNDFRGMLIDKLISKGREVFAIVPMTDLKEELHAERQLESRNVNLLRIKINRRGMNPFSEAKLFFSYLKAVKTIKPGIVLTYTIKPNIYGGLACRLAKVPYAINITGLGSAFETTVLLRKFAVLMNRVSCKKAKVIFFENEENRQYFINQNIVDERHTYRLNGAGVDLDYFYPTPYPKGENIKFLFMGRIMKEKGVDELFAAMQELVKNGIKCELDILGGYEEKYEEKIRIYEEDGWLHYYGYQEDVRPYIERCHCFVLPSWHEGMANTNLECAASGRPIITSNIHGCLEAVIENESGFLVEKKNAKDLYDVMNSFASLSYEDRREMGLAARRHMESVFDKKKVVEDTISKLL